MEGAYFLPKLKTANMLWKPRPHDTFTAHTAFEASDSAELQSCQVLSVSVNAETIRPFRSTSEVAEFIAAIWVFIVDLLESCQRAKPFCRD